MKSAKKKEVIKKTYMDIGFFYRWRRHGVGFMPARYGTFRNAMCYAQHSDAVGGCEIRPYSRTQRTDIPLPVGEPAI